MGSSNSKPAMRFKLGDKMYYIGSNQMIQQDYGRQELTIFAVDPKTGYVACTTAQGQWLVGVNPRESQPIENPVPQVAQEAS
ncbi:hypothetical protein JOY44_28445 (plasmid) [Phormidium sp. CLA17]|nr:hypothetical protein [Leptolyngbya sp. Cla-17]